MSSPEFVPQDWPPKPIPPEAAQQTYAALLQESLLQMGLDFEGDRLVATSEFLDEATDNNRTEIIEAVGNAEFVGLTSDLSITEHMDQNWQWRTSLVANFEKTIPFGEGQRNASAVEVNFSIPNQKLIQAINCMQDEQRLLLAQVLAHEAAEKLEAINGVSTITIDNTETLRRRIVTDIFQSIASGTVQIDEEEI